MPAAPHLVGLSGRYISLRLQQPVASDCRPASPPPGGGPRGRNPRGSHGFFPPEPAPPWWCQKSPLKPLPAPTGDKMPLGPAPGAFETPGKIRAQARTPGRPLKPPVPTSTAFSQHGTGPAPPMEIDNPSPRGPICSEPPTPGCGEPGGRPRPPRLPAAARLRKEPLYGRTTLPTYYLEIKRPMAPSPARQREESTQWVKAGTGGPYLPSCFLSQPPPGPGPNPRAEKGRAWPVCPPYKPRFPPGPAANMRKAPTRHPPPCPGPGWRFSMLLFPRGRLNFPLGARGLEAATSPPEPAWKVWAPVSPRLGRACFPPEEPFCVRPAPHEATTRGLNAPVPPGLPPRSPPQRPSPRRISVVPRGPPAPGKAPPPRHPGARPGEQPPGAPWPHKRLPVFRDRPPGVLWGGDTTVAPTPVPRPCPSRGNPHPPHRLPGPQTSAGPSRPRILPARTIPWWPHHGNKRGAPPVRSERWSLRHERW